MNETVRSVRSALELLLVVLLCQQTCLAQVDPWERIKLIEAEKKVQVKLRSGETVKGKMGTWSADGLTVLRGKNKSVPAAKADVAQVAMVRGISRARRALYGSGALAAGSGIAVAWGCRCCTPCSTQGNARAAATVGLMGVTAGVVLLVWALFPQHKVVIYRAQQPAGEGPPAGYAVPR